MISASGRKNTEKGGGKTQKKESRCIKKGTGSVKTLLILGPKKGGETARKDLIKISKRQKSLRGKAGPPPPKRGQTMRLLNQATHRLKRKNRDQGKPVSRKKKRKGGYECKKKGSARNLNTNLYRSSKKNKKFTLVQRGGDKVWKGLFVVSRSVMGKHEEEKWENSQSVSEDTA